MPDPVCLILWGLAALLAWEIASAGAALSYSHRPPSAAPGPEPSSCAAKAGIAVCAGMVAAAVTWTFGSASASTGAAAVRFTGLETSGSEMGALATAFPLCAIGGALLALFALHRAGWASSASEAALGGAAGAGMALGLFNPHSLAQAAACWLAAPALGFAVTFAGRSFLVFPLEQMLARAPGKRRVRIALAGMLLALGVWEGGAAGVNNLGYVLMPLLASPTSGWGAAVTATCVATAVLTASLGTPFSQTGRVLPSFSALDAALLSFTLAGLATAATWMRMPVPMSLAATAGALGVGWAKSGPKGIAGPFAGREIRRAIISPALSFGVAAAIGLSTRAFL